METLIMMFLMSTALVGSLTIGATFALSPVAGILTDRLGLQQTALLGGGIAALGMAASSFLCDHVSHIFVTLC
jgi:MCP family monocarboxylic acid transporter-like MFS transporter 10